MICGILLLGKRTPAGDASGCLFYSFFVAVAGISDFDFLTWFQNLGFAVTGFVKPPETGSKAHRIHDASEYIPVRAAPWLLVLLWG